MSTSVPPDPPLPPPTVPPPSRPPDDPVLHPDDIDIIDFVVAAEELQGHDSTQPYEKPSFLETLLKDQAGTAAKSTSVDLIKEKMVSLEFLEGDRLRPSFALNKDYSHSLCLPLMFYDDDLLSTFASAIGKPVRIDLDTSMATRALYARMCVEVDLNNPLVPVVRIQDEVFRVQYEGLHVICMNCGRHGHKAVQCQFDTPEVSIVVAEGVEPENHMDSTMGEASPIIL
ncbi:hypothetical protein Tsubulata_030411 [Turnera subulata]|uniref:CCHC-type domain-containing protein n=1 Tax=Turnera subulata TaxID=218843 RepID=A0A9Q0JH68_9ROSI|nr:hypothetical protein Tsubulata_030411 [Turnera subulata]